MLAKEEMWGHKKESKGSEENASQCFRWRVTSRDSRAGERACANLLVWLDTGRSQECTELDLELYSFRLPFHSLFRLVLFFYVFACLDLNYSPHNLLST